MARHNEFGSEGEDYAQQYLEKKGYTIIDRDWEDQRRDLDLVALDKDKTTMVFVEVKTRKWNTLVDPEYSISTGKMRNIGKCANAYIMHNNIDLEFRFDVIIILIDEESVISLEHIEDAFNPCLL